MLRKTLLVVLTLMWALTCSGLGEEGPKYPLEYRDGAWTIPEGVVSLDEVDWAAIYFSDPLSSIRFPSTLRSMGEGGDFYAFMGYRMEIPEGVRDLSGLYLEYASLRRVQLPSTLEGLSASTFSDCDLLEHVRIAPGNPFYQVVDDVVFTRDGKTLVYYPAGKKDTHYTVPAGVTTLAEDAFSGNDYLLTLTLPFGLTTLEDSAISDCGRLEQVSMPLTVTALGEMCFNHCVSLSRISLPAQLAVPDNCFRNCPRLENLKQPAKKPWVDEDINPISCYALVSPKYVKDMTPVWKMPRKNSGKLTQLPSGALLQIQGSQGDYYEVHAIPPMPLGEGIEEWGWKQEALGYVHKDDVMLVQQYAPLFEVERVTPNRKLTHTLDAYELIPVAALPENTCDVKLWEGLGRQWLDCWVGSLINEEGECYYDSQHYTFWVGDVTLGRMWTGDDKTYGITLATEPGNRVNLRKGAGTGADSLCKYFSGTQLEVLAQRGNWYQVRMEDGLEGWMQKDYVRIVEQEAY